VDYVEIGEELMLEFYAEWQVKHNQMQQKKNEHMDELQIQHQI